jgi:hypothetical protein
MNVIHHLQTRGVVSSLYLLAALFFIAGCASTKVSNREILVTEKLPMPAHIWVYNFVAHPEDIPADSDLAGHVSPPSTNMTPEMADLGRQLGHEIAKDLVEEIQKMNLPGELAIAATKPAVNDIVIRGYLVSVEEGSTGMRFIIGFGAGGSELTTTVEGYQMTTNGLRKLGHGTLGATGSKGPGAGVGAATWLITGSPIGLIASGGLKIYGEASGSSKVEGRAKQAAKEIGELLKARCEAQGWIK